MKYTIQELVDYNDFETVFKVFEGYPFFEHWTSTEIREEFDMFMSKGKIFGCHLNQKCVGIITILPHEDGKYPVEFEETEKVLYLSDVAVLPQYRRHGIAGELFQHIIVYGRFQGYTKIYLRTNKENSMSYGIAIRCGFTIMAGIEQDVEKDRMDGTVQKDTRIFLEKNL